MWTTLQQWLRLILKRVTPRLKFKPPLWWANFSKGLTAKRLAEIYKMGMRVTMERRMLWKQIGKWIIREEGKKRNRGKINTNMTGEEKRKIKLSKTVIKNKKTTNLVRKKTKENKRVLKRRRFFVIITLQVRGVLQIHWEKSKGKSLKSATPEVYR